MSEWKITSKVVKDIADYPDNWHFGMFWHVMGPGYEISALGSIEDMQLINPINRIRLWWALRKLARYKAQKALERLK